MKKTASTLFFNDLDLGNDLEGKLEGSVLFAQSSILPSRSSMLADDIQPRLVSLRNTLLMFRPMSHDLDYDECVQFHVLDKSNATIFSTALNSPDNLPAIAEKIDVDESVFIEPVVYDYIVNSQSEFDKMRNDVNGKYLSYLLESRNAIKIITSDGHWLKNIYLPDTVASHNDKLVTFVQNATLSSNIIYSDKTQDTSRGSKYYFQNIESLWAQPTDFPLSDREKMFADPGAYDYIISGQDEISETANDPEATYFKVFVF